MKAFNIIMPKETIFGADKILLLSDRIQRLNKSKILLLTGDRSSYACGAVDRIWEKLKINGIECLTEKITSEPTFDTIESLSKKYAGNKYDMVVSVGGGSVIDTGKIMSVMPFIKGDLTNTALPTEKIPHIAIPTLAGSGSEITPFAMIKDTYNRQKKIRFTAKELLPDLSIIDPTLTVNCPVNLSVVSGLDAFCHVFEAYISKDANPFIDDLMPDALKRIFDYLPAVANEGSDDIEIRSELSYAAMMSGIGSANTSLTVIHGLADVIGGLYNIAHARIAAALLYPCMLINMQRVQTYDPYGVTLSKFAQIGSLFSGIEQTEDKHWVLLRYLSEKLAETEKIFNIEKLSMLGVKKEDFYTIISSVEQNGNPVELNEADLLEILELAY